MSGHESGSSGAVIPHFLWYVSKYSENEKETRLLHWLPKPFKGDLRVESLGRDWKKAYH